MGGRPSLSILIYHRVLERPDPLLPDVPDVRLFDRQMGLLKRCFRVMPLSAATQHLRLGTLPPRSACITFDDGYADNAQWALPVLRQHGLRACIFVASGYLDGGQMWNDDVIEYVRHSRAAVLDLEHLGCGRLPVASWAQKRLAIQRILSALKYLPLAQRSSLCRTLAPPRQGELMLRSGQVRGLRAAGMEIGAHTRRHPILAAVPDEQARQEMAAGKVALETLLGEAVTLFAYPNGKPAQDYDGRHVAMAAALGFEAAVSTVAGAAGAGSDLLQLPRFTPWEPDRARFLLRLAQNSFRLPA